MRIALTTIPFLPQIGGMEMVVALLAREFVRLGCEVKVVTATSSVQNDVLPYEVIRQPGWKKLWQTYHWADAILLQGLTLRLGWPVLIYKKPYLVTHHMILDKRQYGGKIRRALLARSRSVSVSHAVAKSLPVPSEVIHNPYDSEIFNNDETQPRTRDLVFVGRLCAEKGVDLLIAALKLLAEKNLRPSLTIVGDGKERHVIETQVRRFDLGSQVHFVGAVSKQPLAKILQNNRIIVVPSRCEEGFGIVAMEGIACGCVVIGSSGGGLPEAIGPCGVTFPNGDAAALAKKIQSLLSEPDQIKAYQENAERHLANHKPETVARQYLQLMGLN
jgi:glycosyltransferase involved in cell wall biosynthesis